MQTLAIRSQFPVRSVVSFVLAVLLALAAFGALAADSAGASFAVVDEDAQEQTVDDSINTLINSLNAPLTRADITFFEENVMLPAAVSTDNNPSDLAYPWTDNKIDAH